jgi:hypothetical protein
LLRLKSLLFLLYTVRNRVRVKARFRVRVKVRVKVIVRVKVRGKVRVRIRVKVRVKVIEVKKSYFPTLHGQPWVGLRVRVNG